MRKHLERLATSCKTSASLLAGNESIFDDWYAVEPPRGILPRDARAAEARNLIHRALQSRDATIHAEYRVDPELRNLEPMPVALQLAQLALASELAAKRIGPTKGGRPDGGSASLVQTLIDVLRLAGADLNCRFDASLDKFSGSFVLAATWLRKTRVQEKHSTLCRYAADYLRRRSQAKNKPDAIRRVRS